MEAFLVSAGVVGLAEIGDKTQLLALVLAARYRKPVEILLGILLATLANHAAAAYAGAWIGAAVSADWMRYALALSFFAMTAWTLIPDRLSADGPAKISRHGAFLATLVAFFLVEIGDKTQIATVVLAARFETLAPIVLGTTLGMMIANGPCVFIGDRGAKRLPLRAVRAIAAAVFFGLGTAALLS